MKLILTIFWLTSATLVFGQVSYYDALFLKKFAKSEDKSLMINPDNFESKQENDLKKQRDLVENSKEKKATNDQLQKIQDQQSDSILMILKFYFPALEDNMSNVLIDSIIHINPFFKTFKFTGSTKGGGGLKMNELFNSLASSAGGLNVTNVANALADIMIEHAKQELTVAFFDRFKKFVDENEEFKILFPKTTQTLGGLLSYKYPEMLPALRTAFLDDLEMITFRLDDVLDLPRYKKLFEDLPEATVAIRSLRLVHELGTGASNAADVIKEFSEFPEWKKGSSSNGVKHVGSILKISALLSESIRSKSEDSVWVSAKGLKKLIIDSTLFKIYLGLIYQKAEHNTAIYIKANGDTIKFTKLLKDNKDNLFAIETKLRELFDLTARVNATYQDIKIKTKKGETPSNDDYYSYINTSLDVIDYGFSIVQLFGEDTTEPDQYVSLLRESNDLYRNIYRKEYNQAIVNTIDIITKIIDQASKITYIDGSGSAGNKLVQLGGGKSVSFKTLDQYVTDNGTTYFISSSKIDVQQFEKLRSSVEKVKPYALFMANMVDAKSEEDIKNALENVILPVGSSAIKKNSVFNISLQSYLGAGYNGSSSSTENAWRRQWGITAPVGVAFSWGLGGNGRVFKKNPWKPGSFSLFASLFDIGAIVDYKLTSDGTKIRQDYEIKLGQILSPGAYAVIGLPWGLPLSLGAGGQYGPGIFKTDNGIQTITPDWRFNVFLAVDIPLLTLKNNSRTK